MPGFQNILAFRVLSTVSTLGLEWVPDIKDRGLATCVAWNPPYPETRGPSDAGAMITPDPESSALRGSDHDLRRY